MRTCSQHRLSIQPYGTNLIHYATRYFQPRKLHARELYARGFVSKHGVSCGMPKQIWCRTCPTCVNRMLPRGLKTSSSITISSNHQGVLPPGAPIILKKEDGPAYPPVIQQAWNNIQKFSHCVVLTRVGSFYELYFDQAKEYGPLMNLKIGKKSTINGGPVPMAGFPDFQLDRFLKILVQDLNKHVAISEQYENDPESKAKSGLMHDRRISRIITPGTLIDERFIDPFESNYLLSVTCNLDGTSKEQQHHGQLSPNPDVGVAWLDLSSGEFFTQETNLDSLASTVARIAPREILLDSRIQNIDDSRFMHLTRDDFHIVIYVESVNLDVTLDDWLHLLRSDGKQEERSEFSPLEVAAGSTILQFVNKMLLEKKPQLLAPLHRDDNEFMTLDKNTLRALEIRETIRDHSFQGSLLHTIRETVTKSGSRLLNQRLTSPSMSTDEINTRLDFVTELLDQPVLHENLVTLLMETSDSSRLVQKFSFGRGDADDLLSLSRTIKITVDIAQSLQSHIEQRTLQHNEPKDMSVITRQQRFEALIRKLVLENPKKLSNRILNAIDEDRLMEVHRIEDNEAAAMVELAEEQVDDLGEAVKVRASKNVRAQVSNGGKNSAEESLKDRWIMQRTASRTLKQLHEALDELRADQEALENNLRSQIGSNNLHLRWTPGLGHIVHVKGSAREKAAIGSMETARSVKSSKTTQSFYLVEWTRLGERIEKAKKRIQGEEDRIFGELRAQVVRNLVELRKNAGVLDELDVACSFTTLARKQRLVRPLLNSGTAMNIVGGRHPTVESGLARQGRQFTSNNLHMSEAERIMLITGPNMGGKSTFLRQNALIAILAQTGSYVPAEYAELGLVDKIFSRVGSADNLYEDQSTFMVEMLETADILKQATPRSFVIMDEVGRGTTPEDGLAVGFTALHHLYHVNKSRVLFATHFHALTDMVKDVQGISCYCTDVAEDTSDGSWMFVHKLSKGVNRESHALKVAQLAGLPDNAINVATNVLSKLHALPERNRINLPRIDEAMVG